MRIFVMMKQLGKRRDVLGRIPFDLPEAPRTLRDLLTMMVKTMVAQYNTRQLETPVFHYLTEDDLLNSAEQTGKVGFGTRYNVYREYRTHKSRCPFGTCTGRNHNVNPPDHAGGKDVVKWLYPIPSNAEKKFPHIGNHIAADGTFCPCSPNGSG